MAALIRSALVLTLVLAATQVARAQEDDAQHLLDEGRRLYADLEYQEAETTLARALALPGLPDAFRVQVLEWLGFVQVVEDQEAAARSTFERLFAIDPYYVVREPSGSPRVTALVTSVRARVVHDAAIDPDAELRVELPSAARRDGPTEVRLTASSPDITQAVIHVRADHEVAFRTIDVAVGSGSATASLPAIEGASELELFVEARDARGRLVTRSGSALVPLRLTVRGEASPPHGGSSTPIYEEWWLWTIVGVVVVGAAVGVGVGVAVSNEALAPGGTLPPGRVIIP